MSKKIKTIYLVGKDLTVEKTKIDASKLELQYFTCKLFGKGVFVANQPNLVKQNFLYLVQGYPPYEYIVFTKLSAANKFIDEYKASLKKEEEQQRLQEKVKLQLLRNEVVEREGHCR